MKAFETLKESEISSRSLQLTAVFAVLDSQLSKVAKYSDNWDSYGAPAPAVSALDLTRHLLQAARLNLVEPTTVVASAEGGVATYFIRGRKICYIEYQNSGEGVLGMYGDQVPTAIVEIATDHQSTTEALKQIREYFLP
ncbi:MAG: hypothetical protein ACRD45_10200 [Bryobacteraceae bacterium]